MDKDPVDVVIQRLAPHKASFTKDQVRSVLQQGGYTSEEIALVVSKLYEPPAPMAPEQQLGALLAQKGQAVQAPSVQQQAVQGVALAPAEQPVMRQQLLASSLLAVPANPPQPSPPVQQPAQPSTLAAAQATASMARIQLPAWVKQQSQPATYQQPPMASSSLPAYGIPVQDLPQAKPVAEKKFTEEDYKAMMAQETFAKPVKYPTHYVLPVWAKVLLLLLMVVALTVGMLYLVDPTLVLQMLALAGLGS